VDLKITQPSFRQRGWKAIKIKPEGAEFLIHEYESTTNYITNFHKTRDDLTL